ncbi:MAG: RNA polymerase factor sigma-54 [Oscillospiraceae bacterium]
MDAGMNLNQSQNLSQQLSPQMIQSMEILQMGAQELLEYIEETVLENPVLEIDEKDQKQDDFSVLQRKIQWLESTDTQNSYYYRQDDTEDDPLERYGGTDQGEETLYFYVLSQLSTLACPPKLLGAAKFLVESLNQSGWLDEDVPALASEYGAPEALMSEALNLVQSLEPAGIGARNLSECLRLQLVRRGEHNALALRIVSDYLEALAKNRYGLIAKELGASADEVREACDLIKQLNPRPGTGFAAREHLVYINPDIFVVNFPDHFELLTNDYFFPSLHMSAYYQSLMKETTDPEVKDYLTGKIRQATWVVRSIDQRRSTLMDCAQCILERQEAFFRKGPGHLLPMSMADVAEKLGVHESTVSRAVRDKYLQCSQGVYPLGYFFSRGLGTATGDDKNQDGPSPDAAKALLKKLIAGEDKRKPLSDQKLCDLMAREGCNLARRTVAKYRDELRIPGTTGRKEYPLRFVHTEGAGKLH